MKIIKTIIAFILCVALCFGGFTAYRYITDHDTIPDSETLSEHISNDEHVNYYYSQLDETQQLIYETIYYAYSQFESSIIIQDSDPDTISLMASFVLYDHPELYYVNPSYTYVNDTKYILYPTYYYDEDEVTTINEQLNEQISDVITYANSLDSDMEKAKYLYDYVIENVEYVVRSGEDQTMTSALLDGQSVCAGYAKAYQYLLSQVDIDSAYIPGTSLVSTSTSGHAWTMVEIDGDYYYCDTTWGDVTTGVEHACNAYFMMSSDETLRCYKPDYDYYEITKYYEWNYFATIDCYMETYERGILSKAVRNNDHVAEIKCANEEVYNEVVNKIKNDYLAYYVLKENNKWSNDDTYYCNDYLYVIELFY